MKQTLTSRLQSALTRYVNGREKAYQYARSRYGRPVDGRVTRAISQIKKDLEIAAAQRKTFRGYCVMINRLKPHILAILPPERTTPSQLKLRRSALAMIDLASGYLNRLPQPA